MYKVVVSDLDGTLLKPDHSIGEVTRQALERIASKGVKFGIATGRPWKDVVGISEGLKHEFFLITSNGARVHDHLGNCLYRRDIPSELVNELVNIAPPSSAFLNVYQGTQWLVTKANPRLLGDYAASGFGYCLVGRNEVPLDEVSKLFWIGDHEELCDFKKVLKARFGDALSITFSAPRYLEVMAAGVSKGEALEHYLSLCGLGMRDVLAFGDADNDFDMLARAKKGILMANASDSLRESLPRLECIGSSKDESVAKYITALFG